MNNELISLWNNKVSKNDVVFYLGDFSFGKQNDTIGILKKLNGHIIFICGNHDYKFNSGDYDNYLAYNRVITNKIPTFVCLGNLVNSRIGLLTIDEVLNFIEESGFDLENDVGIITPYRNQSSKLISKFKTRINHTRKLEKIGTVHKFQGAEFPIVIFSPVVGTNDSINFINNKPNMLNVAVSRAKFVFITVGNIGLLKKGTYSNKIVIE